MIRDRGSKKWVSIFPTELVGMLRDWRKEDDITARPELDNWDMDSIHEQIDLARTRQCEIQITSWRDGQMNVQTGVIQDVIATSRILYLDQGSNVVKVLLDEIVGVNIPE